LDVVTLIGGHLALGCAWTRKLPPKFPLSTIYNGTGAIYSIPSKVREEKVPPTMIPPIIGLPHSTLGLIIFRQKVYSALGNFEEWWRNDGK